MHELRQMQTHKAGLCNSVGLKTCCQGVCNVMVQGEVFYKLIQEAKNFVEKCFRKYLFLRSCRARALLAKNPVVHFDLSFMNFHSPLLDHPFFLNPKDEGLSVDLMDFKIREPLNISLLHKFLNDNRREFDAIVDVGSNVGYFPFLELAFGAKKIVAIEPVPESFEFLKKNTSRFNNVQLLNCALTDRKQTVYMVVTPKRNQSRCVESSVGNAIKVCGVTLEDVVESFNLNDCKLMVRMDVEGYEETILRKLPSEVVGLAFELHANFLGYERSLEVLNRLIGEGFHIDMLTWGSSMLYVLIEKFGLARAIALHNAFSKHKRLDLNPTFKAVKEFLGCGEGFHLYATRHLNKDNPKDIKG